MLKGLYKGKETASIDILRTCNYIGRYYMKSYYKVLLYTIVFTSTHYSYMYTIIGT